MDSKLSEIWSGMFIRDPNLDFLTIPDPRFKKAPDPRSATATLADNGKRIHFWSEATILAGTWLIWRTIEVVTCCFCSAQAHNITDVVVACRETGLQYRVLQVLCSAQAHNITDVVVACRETGLQYRVLNVLFSAQAHNITDVVVACRETGLQYRVLHVFCSAQAHNITDVVVACRETGLEWFEQLLQTLFKPKEDKDDATKACRRINKRQNLTITVQFWETHVIFFKIVHYVNLV